MFFHKIGKISEVLLKLMKTCEIMGGRISASRLREVSTASFPRSSGTNRGPYLQAWSPVMGACRSSPLLPRYARRLPQPHRISRLGTTFSVFIWGIFGYQATISLQRPYHIGSGVHTNTMPLCPYHDGQAVRFILTPCPYDPIMVSRQCDSSPKR